MTRFTNLLKETEQRFKDRSSIRTTIRAKLDQGLLLQADSAERVQKRLQRLGFSASEAQSLAGSDRPLLPTTVKIDRSEIDTLERIIHKSDLMAVNFFDRGSQSARSIGRIRIRATNGEDIGYGTGFLVSPRLLLTNNHVLPDIQTAQQSQVEFDFQDGLDGQPLQAVLFDLEPDVLFLTDEALDYSLVSVRSIPQRGIHLKTFGWHPLIELEGKAIVGEYLSIIQHPNGEPKQVALRENQLIDVLPDFLHYETDTAPGSSGSPVFNDQWEVVALHHSGVPKRDSRGRILNIDGKPWKPEQGEHRVAWLANEGVRVSRIIQHIKNQPISGQAEFLITELLSGKPMSSESNSPTPASSTETNMPPAIAPSVVSEDGRVTWTIPLQVIVQLGQPTIVQPSVTISPSKPSSVSPSIPPSTVPTTTPSLSAIEEELEQAIAELQAAAKKPYYDAVKDEKNRDKYYEQLLPKVASINAKKLYQELNTLLTQTHKTKPAYQPARHLYPWVDLHPDLKIRSIYSEQAFEAATLIQADFQIEKLRVARSQELILRESLSSEQFMREMDLLEASLPYNCEHVVPQSWFAKKEPMRGDLHHLFACETRCNSFRGNIPYFDFADFGEVIRDQCGKLAGKKFEPNAGKGAIARATLYFLVRYPGEINKVEQEYQESRLEILLDWHRSYPVSEYEKHRNAAIFEKQGNRNPLIDFPEWADKVAFRLGLGA